MILIENLSREKAVLIDCTDVMTFKKIDGESTLSFTAMNTENNKEGYDMIDYESILKIGSESFRVKNVEATPYSKNVLALSTFFDCIDDYVEESYPDGLYTIYEASQLAFSTSEWTCVIEGSYPQRAKLESFGNDNAISMLNKIINAFNSEYEYNTETKVVTIKRTTMVQTDYLIMYKHNMQSISVTTDSTDLKTRVKVFYNLDEFGNYTSSITYISPNEYKYGRPKWRDPIFSDNITSEAGAISTARLILKDTPDIVISTDFTVLQDIGYYSDDIKLGNGVYLVDERMGIKMSARITELTEYPLSNQSPQVTVSSFKKIFTDNLVNQELKQAEIEKTAVIQRNIYNGCTISKEEGFKAISENGVETIMNASEGIKVSRGGIKKFFLDANNDEMTLDGRLMVTNNGNLLLDGYMNSAGGVLDIFDADGNKNIELGSNKYDANKNGGSLRIFDDLGSLSNQEKIELLIERGTNSGQIRLMNSNDTDAKVLLTAEVREQSMFILGDNNGDAQTFLGTDAGFIKQSRIITAELLQPQLDSIWDAIQHLQDEIDDLQP